MKPTLGMLVYFHPPGLGSKDPQAAFVFRVLGEDTAALTVLGYTGVPYTIGKASYDPKGSDGTWSLPGDLPIDAAEA